MEQFFQKGILEEQECERSISYILKDNQMFSDLEYKMLEVQNQPGLLKCVKVMRNGHIRLVYLTGECRRLDTFLKELGDEEFLGMEIGILCIIRDLRENKFSKSSHLDIAIDRIYIDWRTRKPKLVYLPVMTGQYGIPPKESEKRIRELLAQWVDLSPMRESRLLETFRGRLIRVDSYPLETLCRLYQEKDGTQICVHQVSNRKRLVLKSDEYAFYIEKEKFLIGRDAAVVDGLIQGNLYVGRKHCMVTKDGSCYYLTDLKSKNHTYLNNKQLVPNQTYQLKDGDRIRISNLMFRVWIREKEI